MSDPVLLLTPLRKEGHNLKGATAPGDWVPITGTLGELGRALDVDDKAKVDVVRSTPDPWAQASSFAEAVLNPSTLLANMASQWRGLLALFALSAEFEDNYKIELVPVPLSDRSSRFAQVMRHLLPQASVPAPPGDIGHGWDRPIIVRVFELDRERKKKGSGYDVGLLNPASLVAAGRDADRLRISAVPWMREGLTDPTRLTGSKALPPTALVMLERFVRGLYEQVGRLCGQRGNDQQQATLRSLRAQLLAFADECRDIAASDGAEAPSIDLESGDLWTEGLPELYRMLAQPVRPKAAAPGTSQCIIPLRADLDEKRGPPFKGLVLLDPALATPDRPATRISFWGRKTLQQAIQGPDSDRQGLREAIAKAGYLMVTPDDFYTDVLVRLDDDENPARIPAHGEGLGNALLPLSPLALLVRGPQELGGAVKINREGKVSFQVTVGDRSHAVSRRYTDRPQAGEGRALRETDWGLGDFAIWPDFRSEVWHHYFARIDYATNSINRLRGRFAMSGRLLANILRETQSDEERAVRVGPWLDPSPLSQSGKLDRIPEFSERKHDGVGLVRLRASNSGGKAAEIQSSAVPFEAAFFTVAPGGDQLPVPAGLALFNLPELINPSDRIGHVAIDFGTTNTVACLNDTAPVRLRARLVHPLQSAGAGDRGIRSFEQSQKFRDFFPLDERLLPSPTAIIGRPLDEAARKLLESDGSLDNAILFRHLMYFQPDFAEDGTISAVPIKEWSSLLNNIKYNLKWSRSPEMRDAARRYLRQTMLMIAAEWTAGGDDPTYLRWHFSRPKDMGDDSAFMGQLKLALGDILANPAPDAVRKIVHEGDAAAAYILSEEIKGSGTKGAINLILDIGGGTTDIAIWDNGLEPRQLLSVSMRLAGGDFFTGHIVGNPEILEDFGLKAWSGVIRQLNQESDADLRNNLRHVGELLFSGKTLDNAIEREWSRISDTDAVRALKETAYVFLGGVAWFIGRHLRNLIRDGRVPKEALSDIVVSLCGRGSGLFARLHGTDPYAQTDISRIMLLIAAAAGEARPRFPQVQVSPVPKIEVAAGMIIGALTAMPEPISRTDRNDAGISFDSDLSPTDSVDPETAGDGEYSAMPLEVGIEDLDAFLSAFSRVAGFRLTVEDQQRAKLVNGVTDIDREDLRDGRPRQSEFAAVLKVLVNLVRLRPGDPARPRTVWN